MCCCVLLRDALALADDLTNALVELEGEEGVPVVPVELVSPDVAKIFSKSPRAKVCVYAYVCVCVCVCVHVCVCLEDMPGVTHPNPVI